MDKLIKYLSDRNISAFAREIGMSPSQLFQILTKVRPFPIAYAPLVELASEREVMCEDICPQVRWDILRIPPYSSPDLTPQ